MYIVVIINIFGNSFGNSLLGVKTIEFQRYSS